ncbi:hypothetical protein [Niabella aurantiaca]|uniref:hypothetical protein n=1 Tax=Niabella aurantiaca TaxID=379900 RepID=UPI0012FA25EF|nr:hypothetical protein [Niabella aurantiaca]
MRWISQAGPSLVICGLVVGVLLLLTGGLIELLAKGKLKRTGHKIGLWGVILMAISFLIGCSICSLS